MKFQKQLLYLFFGIVTFSCTSKKSNPNPDRIAPVADFSASQTNITTGGSINFTDLSTESPTSWSWTFQGGTPATSTVKNPTNIQYNTAGTYTVTLTATNADGNNTKTKTGYITVATVNTQPPTVATTFTISNITTTTATSGGNITNQGSSAVTKRGICWSTSSTPTVANDTTINGSGIGSFSSSLTGLTANTTYYVRAYATNSNGTGYGNELNFKSFDITNPPNAPKVTTLDASAYSISTARATGNVDDQGGSAITARGMCWSISSSPTIADNKTTQGGSTGSFSSTLTGLTPNTTYYVRAYATNSYGTGYGRALSFITPSPQLPTLTTTPISKVVNKNAMSGVVLTATGSSSINDLGVCINTSPNPTISNIKFAVSLLGIPIPVPLGSYGVQLSNLTPNTTYYVRAYATNSYGTSYGNEISFTSSGNCGTLTDIDGNVYNTITIGTQCWMVENLKTTKYNDGSLIKSEDALGAAAWIWDTSGMYTFVGNNSANIASYGLLYNWFTINTGKLAPVGWHVPTEQEFNILRSYLTADALTGGLMKSTSNLWQSPNEGATNYSGFSALPAGGRQRNGSLWPDVGRQAYFWTSSKNIINSTNYASAFSLYYSNSTFTVYGQYLPNTGFSVRCIKD